MTGTPPVQGRGDAAGEDGLGWLRLGGDPHSLGRALGAAGRIAVARHLLRHPLWREVNDPAHAGLVARMAGTVARRFPAIHAEIAGLAEGLGLPFLPVFAWNCRGDLLAAAPEGCTTVMIPGSEATIVHNEDGFPFLRGHCFMAEVAPEGAPGFTAFCYPGSIPGHAFGWTAGGLVQTVNNLRLAGVAPEVPRMVLVRAVLAAPGLDAAVGLLRESGGSGGYHLCLARAGDARLLSVEFGGGAVSVRTLTRPAAHANHALHHPAAGPGAQGITRSSADRQARAEGLLSAGADPVAILSDLGDTGGLPIWRGDPDDPDEENTLAQARLTVTAAGVGWAIRDARGAEPRYTGPADGTRGQSASSVSKLN